MFVFLYYHRKKDSYLKCTLYFSGWQTAVVSDADVGFLPQGVKAVLAESYERIHRSNLVGMGVIPLEYLPGDSAESLGLSGRERFSVIIPPQITPRMTVHIKVERQLSLKSAALSWFLFRKHLTSSDHAANTYYRSYSYCIRPPKCTIINLTSYRICIYHICITCM